MGSTLSSFLKIYANNNEFDKVDSIFSIVDVVKKNDIYKIYLSTWLTNKDSISQKQLILQKIRLKYLRPRL